MNNSRVSIEERITLEPEEYRSIYRAVHERSAATGGHYGHSCHGRPVIDHVVNLLSKRERPVLVDLGCGGNEFAAEVQRAVPHAKCCGVDIVAHEPLADGAHFEQCDARAAALHYGIASIDVLTAFDFLEHLAIGDMLETLSVWAPRIKSAGLFITSVGMGHSRNRGPGDCELHLCRFGASWWRATLASFFGRRMCPYGIEPDERWWFYCRADAEDTGGQS